MSCKYETVFFSMMVSNWCFVLQNKVIKECCTPCLCGLLFFDFIPDCACSVFNAQDLGTKNCVSYFSVPLLILLKSFLLTKVEI